jgi:hypothetical protein
MESTTPRPSKTRSEELRLRIQERFRELREKPRMVPVNPPPRYDEVFFQGTQWLDKLAAGADLYGDVEP